MQLSTCGIWLFPQLVEKQSVENAIARLQFFKFYADRGPSNLWQETSKSHDNWDANYLWRSRTATGCGHIVWL